MTILALASTWNRWVAEDVDQITLTWLSISVTSLRSSGRWSTRRGRQRLMRLNKTNSPCSGLYPGNKYGKTWLFLHIYYICMTCVEWGRSESRSHLQGFSCYLVEKIIWIHSELDSDWSGSMSCLGYSLVMLGGLNLTCDSWLSGQGHLIVRLATCFLNPGSSCIIKVAPSLFGLQHRSLTSASIMPSWCSTIWTDSGYK